MNNTPEAVARILAIAQLDADKETFFEQWYFDAFKLDVIPRRLPGRDNIQADKEAQYIGRYLE